MTALYGTSELSRGWWTTPRVGGCAGEVHIPTVSNLRQAVCSRVRRAALLAQLSSFAAFGSTPQFFWLRRQRNFGVQI